MPNTPRRASTLSLLFVLGVCHSSPATQLGDAVRTINSKEMRRSLASGANVNESDQNQDTALHWAVFAGSVEMTAYLLAHGANPAGQTPYDLAVEGNDDTVAPLVHEKLTAQNH